MLARVPRVLRDALYLTVGAGVLAYQRAQVQRRDLEARLNRVTGRAAN